jgi:RNA polymerase sigma-70 factor (ECF subfamily)
MNPYPPGIDDAHSPSVVAFDEASPVVYRYLRRRCGSTALAEDLTAATFVSAVANRRSQEWPIRWLITIARNKLTDHWRREEHARRVHREQRASSTVDRQGVDPAAASDDVLDVAAALEQLSIDHRLAIVLRYLDDLPVAEVAAQLGRSVRATESLLVRARQAFRDAYEPDAQERPE